MWKKKTKFFSVFDNANQLLTRHLLFVPFAQVDKWMAKPSPFPIQGHLLEFSRILAVKTLKNLCSAYRKWLLTIYRRDGKPKYKKKNQNLHIQWLWQWHSLPLTTNINCWKICHRPIFPKRTKSITENFVYWHYAHLCFVMIQHIFSSWA